MPDRNDERNNERNNEQQSSNDQSSGRSDSQESQQGDGVSERGLSGSSGVGRSQKNIPGNAQRNLQDDESLGGMSAGSSRQKPGNMSNSRSVNRSTQNRRSRDSDEGMR